MSSKQSPKKKQEDKKDATEKDSKKGTISKLKCHAPIAVASPMTQRTLTPTVCCPPRGCPVRSCLHGPGYRNC